MEYFIQGVGFGLLLSILVGPLFLSILQTAIQHSVKAALVLCAGIITSDIFFILFTYFAFAQMDAITKLQGFERYVGLIGGIVLIFFGIVTYVSKLPDPDDVKPIGKRTFTGAFIQGFLINTINPFTIFYWVTVATAIVAKNDLQGADAASLYGGILITITCMDIVKAKSAQFLKRFLKSGGIVWVKRIAGLGLAIFGAILIIRTF